MADYKEMYFKLFAASEQAIQDLIQAQKECEELCLQTTDASLVDISQKPKDR